MTYTDCGTCLSSGWDACPLAVANGIEWSFQRKGFKDRHYNLYKFKKCPLSWVLWEVGYIISFFYKPTWIK